MKSLYIYVAMHIWTQIYSSTNEQFWDTFPWQDFFPDISLTVNIIPDISLTCFKFPDISRFSRQVATLPAASASEVTT